jgi:cyclic pyranopterin phosphate synthase
MSRPEIRMVDVGAKPETARRAVAEARIIMNSKALAALSEGNLPKGDALAAARLAGIMATKRTADLIPLCHPLPLTSATVDLSFLDNGIAVTASAETMARTGVEMEALTAAAVAALTLYDMLKSLDREMRIEGVRLIEKSGGKSGDFKASG